MSKLYALTCGNCDGTGRLTGLDIQHDGAYDFCDCENGRAFVRLTDAMVDAAALALHGYAAWPEALDPELKAAFVFRCVAGLDAALKAGAA